MTALALAPFESLGRASLNPKSQSAEWINHQNPMGFDPMIFLEIHINIYIYVCWSDVPIYIYINQWIWCSNGFPIEINQKNPMAFTMGFHNDLPMMFGLTMAFTMDFPMMFQWKITQNHGFYHGLNMMEILRLSAFCQCSSAPQKARKPKPKDGPKMWCLKLRIPKMTVFLLGKMMIIRSPPIFGLP